MTQQDTQATPKATKIAQARELFNQIKNGEIPEGSSVRKEFIARAQGVVGISAACATTYYNNLKNEAKGEDLYKYTRGARKKTDIATNTETEATQEVADVLGTFDEVEAEAEELAAGERASLAYAEAVDSAEKEVA